MLCAGSSLLARIEEEFPVTAFRVDFSKGEQSSQLNGLFKIDGVHGMLKAKDCHCINMMLPFIRAYLDRATRYIEDEELTKKNTMYSELLLKFYSRCSKMNTDSKACMSPLKGKLGELKDKIVLLIEDHCEWGLASMKLSILYHLRDDLEKIRSKQFLDAAPCEHFNGILKRAYHIACKKRAGRTQVTASALKAIVDVLKIKGKDGVKTEQSLLKARQFTHFRKRAVSLQGMLCRKIWTNCEG